MQKVHLVQYLNASFPYSFEKLHWKPVVFFNQIYWYELLTTAFWVLFCEKTAKLIVVLCDLIHFAVITSTPERCTDLFFFLGGGGCLHPPLHLVPMGDKSDNHKWLCYIIVLGCSGIMIIRAKSLCWSTEEQSNNVEQSKLNKLNQVEQSNPPSWTIPRKRKSNLHCSIVKRQ